MTKYWPKIILAILSVIVAIAIIPFLHAQEIPDSGDKIDGFPVIFANESLFVIQADVGSFSSQERAATISRRIENIAADSTLDLESMTVEDGEDTTNIIVGSQIIVTVTEDDAKNARQPRQQLARNYLELLKQTLREYREERSVEYLIRAVVHTIAATIFLIITLFLIARTIPWISHALKSNREIRTSFLSIPVHEIFASSWLTTIFMSLVKFIRLILVISIFYVYFTLVFGFFPWTQKLGENLLNYFLASVELAIDAFVVYLPNLFVVIFIIIVTYYTIRFCKLFFSEIEIGDISFPGFYREWAQPTYKLSIILILALAVVIAFPYLPGAGSPAFQGVSLFLGLLFSLGSTAAIANIVGGVILIYTRAFEVGDRVKIDDAIGDIVEKTLLVTRIRTTKNVVITMPNSTVLSSNIVNFSSALNDPKTHPLILHTTITLGYDVPWRKVHRILLDAALATQNILTDPAPFILQTSLDDFYVSYELNAYTDRPLMMAEIYSELHKSIQDRCNESDIEILSPHYSAVRDGHQITIPENYLPKDYEISGFRIQSLNPLTSSPQEKPSENED
ncbi:MAG: mechanosensitive ion channel domain-containing protein [Cyanobacteria bacterium P01_E01_bin.42]